MKQRCLRCDFKLKLDDKLILVKQKERGEHSHTQPRTARLVQPQPRARGSGRLRAAVRWLEEWEPAA